MDILITLVIYLLVIAILWWAIQQLPLPEPFRMVAIVLIALVAILLLLRLTPIRLL